MQPNDPLRTFSIQQERTLEETEIKHQLREQNEILQSKIGFANKCLRAATSPDDHDVVHRTDTIFNDTAMEGFESNIPILESEAPCTLR